MPKIVHIHMGMFRPKNHLAALTETAARHELVLIGSHHLMADGRLALLRQALAPRRMVALLIDDHLPPIERILVDDLLNDGVIPVIVAVGDAPTVALISWLDNNESSTGSAGDRHDHLRITGPTPHPGFRRRAAPRNDTDHLRPAA
jgi:hypothetical protein